MADGEGEGASGAEAIPYARFQKVVEERNQLKAAHGTLEQQLQTLTEKAASVDTLASKLREAEAGRVAAEGRFQTFSTIAGAGITDPELVEAVEWQYGKLPQEGRPALGDWLKGLREKPEAAPALLRSVFQSAPPATTTAPPPRKPPTTTGGGSEASGGAEVTPEMVRAARETAIKTGNWTPFKQLKTRMGMGDSKGS